MHSHTGCICLSFLHSVQQPCPKFIFFGILRTPSTFCATFLVLIKTQKRRFAQISLFPLELGLVSLKYCSFSQNWVPLRSKLQIGLACAIFLKRQWYKDLKNSVPKCLTCKHTKTNTQIHKYKIHKYSYGQSCRQAQHVLYF